MSFSLCRLSFGFSALLISMIAIGSDASAQVHQKSQSKDLSLPISTSEAEAQTWLAQSRDYLGAYNMAASAIRECYEEKELDECNNLIEIQNTLLSWCNAENDQNACKVYSNILEVENATRMAELTDDMYDMSVDEY